MKTDLNIPDADGFYAALVESQEGLTPAQAALASARLVFLLANQISEQGVLLECVRAAARPFRREEPGEPS